MKVELMVMVAALMATSHACLAERLVYSNDSQQVTIDSVQGSIVGIKNLLAGEDYSAAVDELWIELGDCIVGSYLHPSKLISRSANACSFEGEMNGITFKRAYTFPEGRAYFNRAFSITNHRKESIVVKRVTDGSFMFAPDFNESTLHTDNMGDMEEGSQVFTESAKPSLYQTSVNVFLRSEKGGLVLGLRYPYWKPVMSESRVALTYDVNVKLKHGETLELPELFCGVYRNSGNIVKKEMDWKPRIITAEQEVMDTAEVRAMQQVMRDYLVKARAPWPGYFIWLNSWWANRDLQGRMGEKQADEYVTLLGQAKMTGCIDSVLIAPVWLGWAGFIAPSDEIDSIGEDAVFPMNPNIRKVTDRARNINMPVWGFCEPNSTARHYRKDRPDWKVKPEPNSDKRLNQNCHANAAYEDWFYRLVSSAMDQAGTKGWAWDHTWVRRPAFCYDASHGHGPGNVEFQQYRNVTGLIGKLRQKYPDNFFEIYWGLKEAGPYALKGLNSLENAYENNSPAPPGMTAADDMRFQHWYNHNYRFIPTYMNLAQLNDKKEANGFQYSILSCLSASSHASLADWTPFTTQAEANQAYKTLRRWKAWANDHLEYLDDRIDLFGQPCRKGAIDGTAHVLKDNGYLFVFNPTPTEQWGSVPLTDAIGLTEGARFQIQEISSEQPTLHSVIEAGKALVFSIGPKSAHLFRVSPSDLPLKSISAPADAHIQTAFQP